MSTTDDAGQGSSWGADNAEKPTEVAGAASPDAVDESDRATTAAGEARGAAQRDDTEIFSGDPTRVAGSSPVSTWVQPSSTHEQNATSEAYPSAPAAGYASAGWQQQGGYPSAPQPGQGPGQSSQYGSWPQGAGRSGQPQYGSQPQGQQHGAAAQYGSQPYGQNVQGNGQGENQQSQFAQGQQHGGQVQGQFAQGQQYGSHSQGQDVPGQNQQGHYAQNGQSQYVQGQNPGYPASPSAPGQYGGQPSDGYRSVPQWPGYGPNGGAAPAASIPGIGSTPGHGAQAHDAPGQFASPGQFVSSPSGQAQQMTASTEGASTRTEPTASPLARFGPFLPALLSLIAPFLAWMTFQQGAQKVTLNGMAGNTNSGNADLGGSSNNAGIFVLVVALSLIAVGVATLVGKLAGKIAGIVTAALGLALLVIGLIQFGSASSAVSGDSPGNGYTVTIGAGVWLTLVAGVLALAAGIVAFLQSRRVGQTAGAQTPVATSSGQQFGTQPAQPPAQQEPWGQSR